MRHKIHYTLTDEAPRLATASFLPILRKFLDVAHVPLCEHDISLAARILAQFPECTPEGEAPIPDALSQLGELCQQPDACIIKLPNISASLPQLKQALIEIQEQQQSCKHPSLPDYKKSDVRWSKVLGSAVNPVLREGNSLRSVPHAVKSFARRHPHTIGAWESSSQTQVAALSQGDFFETEKSFVSSSSTSGVWRIELRTTKKTWVLRESIPLENGDIIDGATLSLKSLQDFYAQQMQKAKELGVLFSLHLKATMMKITDPILFGEAVRLFFPTTFSQYTHELEEVGVNPQEGLAALYKKIENSSQAEGLKAALQKDIQSQPELAMVDSSRGITNLHAPNDVIIDASMAAALRAGGKMWNPQGQLQDTLCVIPDRTYARLYQAAMDFFKENGACDPTTMGSVINVGLMAKKAEEYGSHDKTFQAPADGVIYIIAEGQELTWPVSKGDVFRACQTKAIAVENWVQTAFSQQQQTQNPLLFWLDEKRSHDKCILEFIKKGSDQSKQENWQVLAPHRAMHVTLEHLHKGQDVIAATGNVLRDYLTDLFPILELGTSAKMLSIVPLLKGGGLYETGAGGSAPKHVQQFLETNHLRWDSLGEFLALAAALEAVPGKITQALAQALHKANEMYLSNDKSPKRNVGDLDTRGSHFYLALYWAQNWSDERAQKWAARLKEKESVIIEELSQAQGGAVNIGGYYNPCPQLLDKAMRPSATFNQLLETF